MNKASVQRAIDSVPYWRHKIKLPFGLESPGRIGLELVDRLKLPLNLSGQSVLDIGTFDGLCAFESEKRNARRILAIDTWSGNGTDDPLYWTHVHTAGLGFKTAKKLLRSSVDGREESVYALSPEVYGKFDYVLICGVIYHLRDPIKGINRALSVTQGELLIESAVVRNIPGCSKPISVRNKDARRNPSNWWAFTKEALVEVCHAAGASKVEERSICWPQQTRRYLKTTSDMPLHRQPNAGNEKIGVVHANLEVEILSRRPTFRDGYYWLRVQSDGESAINSFWGWLAFSDQTDIPTVREEPVLHEPEEGRIVLTVTP